MVSTDEKVGRFVDQLLRQRHVDSMSFRGIGLEAALLAVQTRGAELNVNNPWSEWGTVAV
jgi:hypothetical protein